MSADKIKKPILLIHGEEDSNPGTLTMQVNLHPLPALLLTTLFHNILYALSKRKRKGPSCPLILSLFHSFTSGDL